MNIPTPIEVTNVIGGTSVHACVVKGHAHIIRLLFELAGSSEQATDLINKHDKNGFTPLTLSAANADLECTKVRVLGKIAPALHRTALTPDSQQQTRDS